MNMAHKFPGGLVIDDHVPFFSWLVPAVNLNQGGVSGPNGILAFHQPEEFP